MVTTNSGLLRNFEVVLDRFGEAAPNFAGTDVLEKKAVQQEVEVLKEMLALAKPMLKYITVERHWYRGDHYLMTCTLVKRKSGRKELLILRDGSIVSFDDGMTNEKRYQSVSLEDALRWGLEEIVDGLQGAFEGHMRKQRERAEKVERRIQSCSVALKALKYEEEDPRPELPAPLPPPQQKDPRPRLFSKDWWVSWLN